MAQHFRRAEWRLTYSKLEIESILVVAEGDSNDWVDFVLYLEVRDRGIVILADTEQVACLNGE